MDWFEKNIRFKQLGNKNLIAQQILMNQKDIVLVFFGFNIGCKDFDLNKGHTLQYMSMDIYHSTI